MNQHTFARYLYEGHNMCRAAYTGSWDMTEWLRKNLPRVRLHSQSWMILKDILRELPEGYGAVMDELMTNGLIP